MGTILLTILVLAGAWYLLERSRRKTSAMTGGIHMDITLPHDEEWELYHNDFSLCSKKSRVCLSELGIPYRAHHIDLIETGSYENISRRYLKVNPASLVPVLVHNGHPIYESHEQLLYAASHSDNPELLVPADPEKRKLMETWVHKGSLVGDNPVAALDETMGNAVPGLTLPIFATMIETIPYLSIFEGILFHRFKERAAMFTVLKFRGPLSLPKTGPMVKVIERSRKAMHAHLDELEQVLSTGGGPWITGEQFTLADVGMMVIFDRIGEADWQDEFFNGDRPLVEKYWQDLQARASFKHGLQAFSHPTVDRGTQRIRELKQSDAAFGELLMKYRQTS